MLSYIYNLFTHNFIKSAIKKHDRNSLVLLRCFIEFIAKLRDILKFWIEEVSNADSFKIKFVTRLIK